MAEKKARVENIQIAVIVNPSGQAAFPANRISLQACRKFVDRCPTRRRIFPLTMINFSPIFKRYDDRAIPLLGREAREREIALGCRTRVKLNRSSRSDVLCAARSTGRESLEYANTNREQRNSSYSGKEWNATFFESPDRFKNLLRVESEIRK